MSDQEQNTATVDLDVMVFPRLDGDMMTKADIVAHLKDVHGYQEVKGQTLSSNIKVTKDELLKYHEKTHEVLDRLGSDPLVEKEEHWYAGGMRKWAVVYDKTKEEAGGYRRHWKAKVLIPTVAHRHESIEDITSDEVKAQAARARNNEPVSDKPLSVQERKVLKELVDNDFNALKAEMRQFAADALASAKAEIGSEWASAANKLSGYVGKMVALTRKQQEEVAAMQAKHEDQRRALRDQASAEGIVFADRHGTTDAVVQGKADAIKQAEANNAAMLERALMTLERQRLTAQRQVLVSGVSKEAASILDTIPDAKTLMVDAEKKQQSITS